MSVGKEEDFKWMETCLKRKYEIKTKWLGPGKQHSQEIRVLNRIITWESEGIGYEADPRHVEILVEELGFASCATVGTPGTSIEGKTKEEDKEQLSKDEEIKYGALVARANYLAPDRADIAYSVKELAKSMAKPCRGDWVRLKRLGRYLAGRPRMQVMMQWQGTQQVMVGYTDADWAGDKEARRSTSGGCVTFGTHLIKGWSKTQSLAALSSGESELYATLRTSSETFGLMAMAKDLGYVLKGNIYGDASVALGIIHRKGLGKTRHIDTSYVWIQEVAAQRRMVFGKILGKENSADLYTKYFDVSTMDRHVHKLKCKYTSGRPSVAPEQHVISISWQELLQQQDTSGLYKLEQESRAILDKIQQRQRQTPGATCGYLMSHVRRAQNNQVTRSHNNNVMGKVSMSEIQLRMSSRSRLTMDHTDRKHREAIEMPGSSTSIDLRRRRTSLGQAVLQGYKRRVQGYNGSNAAQPDRPWGSTQTGPSGHNRVQHPCLDGCVTGTETQGIAHIPPVVSREDMICLPCEKGSTLNTRMNRWPAVRKEEHNENESFGMPLQPGERPVCPQHLRIALCKSGERMSDKQDGKSRMQSCENITNNHNYYYHYYQQGWDQPHNLPARTVEAYDQGKCYRFGVACVECKQCQLGLTTMIKYTIVQSRILGSNGKCQRKLKVVMLGHDNHPQPSNDNCESPSCWLTIVSR